LGHRAIVFSILDRVSIALAIAIFSIAFLENENALISERATKGDRLSLKISQMGSITENGMIN
jgi:hypothetical protein